MTAFGQKRSSVKDGFYSVGLVKPPSSTTG